MISLWFKKMYQHKIIRITLIVIVLKLKKDLQNDIIQPVLFEQILFLQHYYTYYILFLWKVYRKRSFPLKWLILIGIRQRHVNFRKFIITFFLSHKFCNTFSSICPSLQKFLVPTVSQIFDMRHLVLCNHDLTRNQFCATWIRK